MISTVFAESSGKWCIKVSGSAIKPFFENDQWFVTDNGYHFHPRTEDFTPGFYFGAERNITRNSKLEIGVLVAFPPATLGVIDQYSSTGREYLGTERYSLLTILVSPNIYLINTDKFQSYMSPMIGYSVASEKVITPTFGFPIIWTKNSQFMYGGKAGIIFDTKLPKLYINSEIFLLSINAELESSQTDHKLEKKLGPLGILFGLMYKL